MRPRATAEQGFVQRIVLFLGLSVLSGVLVAGLMLPFFGGAGLVAKDSADSFQALPQSLEIPPLPQRSQILAADGSLLATFYEQNRIDVPLDGIAPIMVAATLAIEDSRFYEHNGLDLQGTLRAVIANARAGDVEQGGSTLTQQLVKNVLIQEAGEDREAVEAARAQNLERKIQELRYAIGLEEQLSKDEILEKYLNISYYGASAYGVEAAARRFFSVGAAELQPPQAALIAGIAQKPIAYDPFRNPEAALARRNIVLDRMVETGAMPQIDADYNKGLPLGLVPSEPTNGCVTAWAPFFCDYVLNVIKNDPVFGETREDRVRLLLRGGLAIRTTLDPQAQEAAQAAVSEAIEAENRVATAIAMVQPGTGDIRAMAINRGFGDGEGQTRVNYASDFDYGGSRGFQPGSTMKTFVLTEAIRQGIPVNLTLAAPARINATGFTSCNGGRFTDEWSPANYGNNGYGAIDMRTATANSVNTYFVQLEQRTGICEPPALAEAMGVRRADGTELGRNRAFVLGTDEVSPLRLAEGYATLAARGMHCDAKAITGVSNMAGEELPVPQRSCSQVLDPGVTDVVTDLLSGVITNGTGTGARLDRPAAGKTGTTDGSIAVWFAGYTPDMAAAVWVGDPRGNESQYALRNVRINGRGYGQLSGGSFAGPIWRQAMTGALEGVPPTSFAAPDPSLLRGRTAQIPQVRGLAPAEAVAAIQGAGYVATVVESPVNSREAEGTVAYTSPRAGTERPAGEEVRIFVSNGRPPFAQAPAAPPAQAPAPAAPAPEPEPAGPLADWRSRWGGG